MKTACLKKPGLLLFSAVVIATLVSACSSEEQASSYRIDTGGARGSYQVAGRVLERVLNDNQAANGFVLENQVSSGSVANINAIASGAAHFGIAQADHQHQAVNGLGEWSDAGPQGNLRAVFSMYTESIAVIAGRDAGIRTIGDLRGKLVDVGSPGSGTHQNAIDVLQAAGIHWKNDIETHEESLDDRLTMFMEGDLDAFFFTAGHPNRELKFASYSERGIRLLSLSNRDEVVAENPYFFKTTIPADLYPKAAGNVDIETIGVNATLLASASVPDDVVYTLTKTVFENLDSLGEFSAEFNTLLDNSFLRGMTAPIHPGALRYYTERGFDIP